MGNISKLRDIADSLADQKKLDEAFVIYDEVYRQIWNAIGIVQKGLNDFSKGFLSHKLMTGVEFKKAYTNDVANSIFQQHFDMDIDQVQNEFIFALRGHVKCICYSQTLISRFNNILVLNEFFTLYTIILYTSTGEWLKELLKYTSPVFENNQLHNIRPNVRSTKLNKLLIDLSKKLKTTDWSELNFILINYLSNRGESGSSLYKSISKFAGKKSSSKSENFHSYESYEKHEQYEKYESYEKHERYYKKSSSKSRGFKEEKTTEEIKSKHYGDILGLTGTITKSQIRKRYLKLIGEYHPDKVENLGQDLRILAAERSKAINEAYDWIRAKYDF